MKNVNINPGGVIGAIVCGGTAAALILPNAGQAAGRPYKLIVIVLIGGALAGNYLWGLLAPKKEN